MLVQRPGGLALDAFGDLVAANDNTEARDHVAQARDHVVEVWAKPKLLALLATYTEECDEVEAMLWDVLATRYIDYAYGTHLDMIGRLVGELRGGRGDVAYQARLRARILINSSYGRIPDVIAVLQAVDLASFKIEELAPANFRVIYSAPGAAPSVVAELPDIIAETRAAGVGASVTTPVDDTPFLWGPPVGAGFGHTSGIFGGSLSHYARA